MNHLSGWEKFSFKQINRTRLVSNPIKIRYSVAKKSDKNLMTTGNLAVCFGPTLLRPEEETVASIMDIKFHNIVVEILIENCQRIGSGPPQENPPPTQPVQSQIQNPIQPDMKESRNSTGNGTAMLTRYSTHTAVPATHTHVWLSIRLFLVFIFPLFQLCENITLFCSWSRDRMTFLCQSLRDLQWIVEKTETTKKSNTAVRGCRCMRTADRVVRNWAMPISCTIPQIKVCTESFIAMIDDQ